MERHLLDLGLVTSEQLQEARVARKDRHVRLTEQLIRLRCVTEGQLASILSRHYRLPFIRLDEYEIDLDLVKRIPRVFAQQHCALPINRCGHAITVAVADPSDELVAEKMEGWTGCAVLRVIALPSRIRWAIGEAYGTERLLLQVPRLHQEQRATPRLFASLPATLRNGEGAVMARTQDMSSGGLACISSKPFARCGRLTVLLELPMERAQRVKIRCAGNVVRAEAVLHDESDPRHLLGIAFSDLPAHEHAALTAYLTLVARLS